MSNYINVPLQSVTASGAILDIVFGISGEMVGTIHLPKLATFSPPSFARLCMILTPGAFFLEPGLQDFNERALQFRDPIVAVDAGQNSTLAVYSYNAENVLIRVDF